MTAPAPAWALLAEVTHACPLHCPYCSNPLELVRRGAELSAAAWRRVFLEAAELGVVQAHISGGEPLLRPDLEEIVADAGSAGIYTQLVTSGLGLDADRLAALVEARLNSIQLSVQDARQPGSDLIAGRISYPAKERAAALIRSSGLPFGVNVVLHRHNLDSISDLIDLALDWGAERLELANVQFYGWALVNRAMLMPTREQLLAAQATISRRQVQLRARGLELVWVLPDYFEGTPKPCMGGWGARSITVGPDGSTWPCPAAYGIEGLPPANVNESSLEWIWNQSPIFNAYRGTDWMRPPCRTCPQRAIDFGGCRCQAFALTGDAARTDPACALSPDHGLIREATTTATATIDAAAGFVYRRPQRRRGDALS
jgi:pyrroloquinoline quinone biosynthesis protein E